MPNTPVKLTPEVLQNFVGYYQLTPTTIYARDTRRRSALRPGDGPEEAAGFPIW